MIGVIGSVHHTGVYVAVTDALIVLLKSMAPMGLHFWGIWGPLYRLSARRPAGPCSTSQKVLVWSIEYCSNSSRND